MRYRTIYFSRLFDKSRVFLFFLYSINRKGGYRVTVLLALAQPTLSKDIRELLVSGGLAVHDEEVFHRKYLNDTIELLSPSMVIIHDLYLPSDLENPEERDLEMLQLIEYWRTEYDNDLRVVYFCVREKQDSFLSDLVARNVLDIFNERQVSLKMIREQLSDTPRFKNVQRFGTGNISVEFIEDGTVESKFQEEIDGDNSNGNDGNLEDQPSIANGRRELGKKISQTAGKTISNTAVKLGSLGTHLSEHALKGTELGKKGVGLATKTAGTIKDLIPTGPASDINSQELMMEDILDLMPVELDVTKRIKPAIIGTVLIAVAGVRPHMGATYTSISIASYLEKLGHSVAIIESNNSQDFDRIHSLYEGEKIFLKKDHYFEIDGIHHYKYREVFNLNELYSLYEYVIMDFGDLQTATGYIDEFQRAHVRCVLCSGDEWKKQWIDEFLYRNNLDKTDCLFIIPSGTDDKRKNIREMLNYDGVLPFPTEENPYSPSREAEEVIIEVLGTYLKSPSRSFSKKALVITSVISVVVTTAIVTIFNLL